MAEVRIEGDTLTIHLSLLDRMLSFHGSFQIPLAHVTNAFVSDFEDLELQYRLEGTNFGLLKSAGVFANPQGLIFADVGQGDCLVVETRGERFPRIAVQLPAGSDPNALAHQIMPQSAGQRSRRLILPGTFRTQRLRGRAFEPDDYAYMRAMDADERVQVPIFGKTFAEEESRGRFGRWLAIRETHGLGFYVFFDEHGHAVGHAGLFPSRLDPAEIEAGYALKPEYWGCGFATEMTRALLEGVFWDPNVARVLAVTRSAHTASRRVMEKCAMELDREFDDERGVALVRYAVTREAWLRENALELPRQGEPL